MDEYEVLRDLALKSATDFLRLYESIPDKNASVLPIRKTFYGQVPHTAEEMYLHTKNVNNYYFGEVGIDVDNDGTIFECRKRGFEQLERTPDFLNGRLQEGSYGEMWSVEKCYGVLYGTTEFMQKQCGEWRRKHLKTKRLRMYFALNKCGEHKWNI